MNKVLMDLLNVDGEIDSTDMAIYEYGLGLIIKKLSHIFLILLLALVCKEFWNTLLFLVVYASIREYSGGYHAKSNIGCYICTLIVTTSVIFFFKEIPNYHMSVTLWMWIGTVICGICIWILSPQETANKLLQNDEKKLYRKMTHRYEIFFGIFSLLGIWKPVVIYSIAIAWVVQLMMLLGGFLQNRIGDTWNKRI